MRVLELLHNREDKGETAEPWCKTCSAPGPIGCALGTATHLKDRVRFTPQQQHFPYSSPTAHHAHSAASYPLLLYAEDEVDCLSDTLQQLSRFKVCSTQLCQPARGPAL